MFRHVFVGASVCLIALCVSGCTDADLTGSPTEDDNGMSRVGVERASEVTVEVMSKKGKGLCSHMTTKYLKDTFGGSGASPVRRCSRQLTRSAPQHHENARSVVPPIEVQAVVFRTKTSFVSKVSAGGSERVFVTFKNDNGRWKIDSIASVESVRKGLVELG